MKIAPEKKNHRQLPKAIATDYLVALLYLKRSMQRLHDDHEKINIVGTVVPRATLS